MSDLQVDRLTTLLRRLLILGRGAGPVVPEISDEVRASVCLENDRIEYRFLGGTHSWMGFASIAAGGAGFASCLALVNPANSGLIATVEFEEHSAAIDLTIVAEATVVASFTQLGASSHTPRDSRSFGQLAGCQLWTRNNAAGLGGLSFRRLSTGSDFPGLVIHPGFGYAFQAVTSNTLVEVSVAWRERRGESSEGV